MLEITSITTMFTCNLDDIESTLKTERILWW
jgi:hypothetical protein